MFPCTYVLSLILRLFTILYTTTSTCQVFSRAESKVAAQPSFDYESTKLHQIRLHGLPLSRLGLRTHHILEAVSNLKFNIK